MATSSPDRAHMILEVTATPRETLIWARSENEALQIRATLQQAGHNAEDADSWELSSLGKIPGGEETGFESKRIFDIGIGADAHAALLALVEGGHHLVWHAWERNPGRKLWGVSIRIRTRREGAEVHGSTVERATHFGLQVRGSRDLGLRMSRESYARINKKATWSGLTRDAYPKEWDELDHIYEDRDHRIYTDEWCEEYQEQALANYDLNIAHFASLDSNEFESALQVLLNSRHGLREVLDLTRWEGAPGLYVMVLDSYRQIYVGATRDVTRRIKQHWVGTKAFDQLLFGDVQSSILSIDSFRALDTTRIFALGQEDAFDVEDELLDLIPPRFTLNRIRGGRDAARFASLLGVENVRRQR